MVKLTILLALALLPLSNELNLIAEDENKVSIRFNESDYTSIKNVQTTITKKGVIKINCKRNGDDILTIKLSDKIKGGTFESMEEYIKYNGKVLYSTTSNSYGEFKAYTGQDRFSISRNIQNNGYETLVVFEKVKGELNGETVETSYKVEYFSKQKNKPYIPLDSESLKKIIESSKKHVIDRFAEKNIPHPFTKDNVDELGRLIKNDYK